MHDTPSAGAAGVARWRMGQGFGIESQGASAAGGPLRARARYLVVIDSAGETLARLFTQARIQLEAFDASTEEVAVMTRGLIAAQGAGGVEWNDALAGHTSDERRGAEVYTLDV